MLVAVLSQGSFMGVGEQVSLRGDDKSVAVPGRQRPPSKGPGAATCVHHTEAPLYFVSMTMVQPQGSWVQGPGSGRACRWGLFPRVPLTNCLGLCSTLH